MITRTTNQQIAKLSAFRRIQAPQSINGLQQPYLRFMGTLRRVA